MENIRNFSIIAHIDHGKSTLADRLLEITGTVEKRRMQAQYLDQLDLERERGITIKMAPVRMSYTLNAKPYTLNLIDTPGHSDFSYEVSRALTAVEGAILLVDAAQGIQAQTLANFQMAKRANLAIVGAVNKVDVAAPDQIDDSVMALAELLQANPDDILKVSGKTGQGVEDLLAAIVERVPPPAELDSAGSRALVFDSFYDEHKGVVAHVRVFDGNFEANQNAQLIATDTQFKIKELGYFAPELKPSAALNTGEIGYIATGIKDPDKLKIGDTLINTQIASDKLKNHVLLGYKEPNPVVFVSFYPEESDEYDELKRALGKLRLNDAALKFEPDYSEVLGRGFKGGFLGRLHFEITASRLEREYNINTVHSFPSVAYKVRNTRNYAENKESAELRGNEEWKIITNPKDFPADYIAAEEPMTNIEMLTPPQYLGAILQLKEMFRLSDVENQTVGKNILVTAKMPLGDLIRDFDDKLKSVSSGFASLSYAVVGYEPADVAKLEVLVAGHAIPGLTRVLPRAEIEREARATVEKLKELLPKQQYPQALQATSFGRIVARENIPALKKDVTGYLYGGDRTRKMKLWKKQQKGKKKLKERVANADIKIPANVFKELLKK